MNEKKTSSKESIGRLFKEKRYPIDRILQPVDNLLRNKPVSGVLLFLAVIIAMVWANSPWSESYHHLWETAFSVGFG